MGTRAEELRDEIDDVRGDLGDTLEAIGDKVSPQNVMERAKADLSEKVDDVKEKVSPKRLAQKGADNVKRGVRNVVGSDDDTAADPVPAAGAAAGRGRQAAAAATGRSGQATGA
ncbi:MAG TPA: DUF3618 domain-containing protein, partial [Acidimicrobiales bacterium]|nr:DUF3618 domain-containing protein [Acidimicrobiales bacterium]